MQNFCPFLTGRLSAFRVQSTDHVRAVRAIYMSGNPCHTHACDIKPAYLRLRKHHALQYKQLEQVVAMWRCTIASMHAVVNATEIAMNAEESALHEFALFVNVAHLDHGDNSVCHT